MLMVSLEGLQSPMPMTREHARSALTVDVQEAARKAVKAAEDIQGERDDMAERIASMLFDVNSDVERELRRAYLLGKADLLAELTGEPRAQVGEKLAYRD